MKLKTRIITILLIFGVIGAVDCYKTSAGAITDRADGSDSIAVRTPEAAP